MRRRSLHSGIRGDVVLYLRVLVLIFSLFMSTLQNKNKNILFKKKSSYLMTQSDVRPGWLVDEWMDGWMVGWMDG